MKKIAVIGAGSIGFTRNLITDILSVKELRDVEIAFTDINEKNLSMVTRLVQRDIDANGLAIRIVSTLDRKEAVKDADVVAVLTEWDDFKGLDLSKIAALMRTKNIVDCRNLWDKTKAQSLGFSYRGVGK